MSERDDLGRRGLQQETGTANPTHSRTFRVFRWIADFGFLRFVVVAAVGGLLVLAGLGAVGVLPDGELPRSLHIAVLFAAVLAAPADLLAARPVRSWLWDPKPVYVVDVALDTESGALWEFSGQGLQELEVVDGSLHWVTPQLVFAKNYEPDAMRIRGTWPGSMSDRELLIAREKLKELRGRLERDAKHGFALRAQFATIVRSAAARATMRVVETFERGTLPDEGESLHEEIDAALDAFDVDGTLELDSSEDGTESDVDEMPDLDVAMPEVADD